MDRLNERMTEIFGHRWTSQYPRDALDTWAKGLGHLTREHIAVGVGNCLAGKLAWPPTLPEFIALCLTPPDLPDVDAAWAEALEIATGHKHGSACSHPVIWHAYCQCGDLAHTDEEIGERRFRQKYPIAARDFALGKPMTRIPDALPAPGEQSRKELTPEERAQAEDSKQRALAELSAMFPGRRRSGGAA